MVFCLARKMVVRFRWRERSRVYQSRILHTSYRPIFSPLAPLFQLELCPFPSTRPPVRHHKPCRRPVKESDAEIRKQGWCRWCGKKNQFIHTNPTYTSMYTHTNFITADVFFYYLSSKIYILRSIPGYMYCTFLFCTTSYYNKIMEITMRDREPIL